MSRRRKKCHSLHHCDLKKIVKKIRKRIDRRLDCLEDLLDG